MADLPVGENLQDHVISDGVEFYTPYPGVSISMANADSLFSTWMYNIFGTGKLHPRDHTMDFIALCGAEDFDFLANPKLYFNALGRMTLSDLFYFQLPTFFALGCI